jgi:hypothetical protein
MDGWMELREMRRTGGQRRQVDGQTNFLGWGWVGVWVNRSDDVEVEVVGECDWKNSAR